MVMKINYATKELPKQTSKNLQLNSIKGFPLKEFSITFFSNNITTLQRKHLIDKRDLLNLSKVYGVEHVERDNEDHLSVEAYVNECLEKEGENQVLLYKRQKEDVLVYPKNEQCALDKNDFALAIMSKFQKSLFQQFASNIVCLDATHGTNHYDFKLVTVLVVDEFGEGNPIAWLISNKEDGDVLSLFFKQIQAAAGNVIPKVIMSDKAPQYYNSWHAIFGGSSKKLICKWHVHHDWQKRLFQLGDKELASTLYKGLCTILDEQDPGIFEEVLKNALDDMEENEKTKEFGAYFRKVWLPCTKEWAMCHRAGAGINTNMYVESFHKTFKYEYLQGKQNKRLDKCIVKLFDFARNQAVKRLIKLEKGRNTWQITEIHKRHLSAKSLKDDTTASEGLKYTILKQNSSCTKSSCKLRCEECDICVHSFQCTCPYAFVRQNICKHIHLLVKFCKGKVTSDNLHHFNELELPSSTNSFCDQISAMSTLNRTDQASILNALKVPEHNENNIDNLQVVLIKRAMVVCEKLKKCQNMQILNSVKGHFNTIDSLLSLNTESLDDTNNFTPTVPIKTHNKKNEIQRIFFSTKAKRIRKNIRFGKPTWEEKMQTENYLLRKENSQCSTSDHSYVANPQAVPGSQACGIIMQETSSTFANSKLIEKKVKILLKYLVNNKLEVISGVRKAVESDVEARPDKIPDKIVDMDESVVMNFFDPDAWAVVEDLLRVKRKDWACANCPKITVSMNMVQCEQCEEWFHWECVNMLVDPGDSTWICNKH